MKSLPTESGSVSDDATARSPKGVPREVSTVQRPVGVLHMRIAVFGSGPVCPVAAAGFASLADAEVERIGGYEDLGWSA